MRRDENFGVGRPNSMHESLRIWKNMLVQQDEKHIRRKLINSFLNKDETDKLSSEFNNFTTDSMTCECSKQEDIFDG